jgi:hypothetical protein
VRSVGRFEAQFPKTMIPPVLLSAEQIEAVLSTPPFPCRLIPQGIDGCSKFGARSRSFSLIFLAE